MLRCILKLNRSVLDEFPLMVDIWEEMFGIDIEGSPQLGLVDISDVNLLFRHSLNIGLYSKTYGKLIKKAYKCISNKLIYRYIILVYK